MIPTNIFQILNSLNANIQNSQNIKTPDDMTQYLLNNRMVTQEQVNQARQIWGNQANVRQMIHNKYRY